MMSLCAFYALLLSLDTCKHTVDVINYFTHPINFIYSVCLSVNLAIYLFYLFVYNN